MGFDSMKVTIGQDLHPRLVIQNAVLRDAEGGVLARVPRIEGLISPRGVLQGTRWAITFMGLAHVPGLCEKFSVGAALGDARICGPALRRLRAGGG